jgi:hypothetical protein
MGFKVRTKRKIEVEHTFVAGTNTYDLGATVEVLAGEDIDYSELRKKLSEHENSEKIISENGEEIDSDTYNTFLYTLRTSIVACKGFEDEDGNDIAIKGSYGKIDKVRLVAVFEAIRNIPDFFEKIIVAYTGESPKN